ncbi:chromate transporter [Meiothermus granaticius]|uniref:Chromate transport protein n=1 Tax=Meiothermus granaticius NBRC 107808 TaxID=1227551 RepID=A0A399F9R7_9DEIN|nr:chromate transporter [Meiothermus granaticius]MCL6526088.1 chromate transporter [Thermaceae bacterium]RIH91999.1 Chromate transport protein [Meiothermus granaticius NBRC 107808]GEM86860.1 chromate transporter [Meiothermus granaticius NBRC 107808]
MSASLAEVFLTFLRFGVLSFGGGMANLPEMARVLLANGWLSRRGFADGFALGQFVPGPNMLAVLFYGLSAAGVGGALAAMLGMFLPGTLGAIALVWAWRWMGQAQWSRALRRALVPIAMGLSFSALLVLAQVSLSSLWGLGGAGLAAVLLYRGANVLAVLIGAALLGWLIGVL